MINLKVNPKCLYRHVGILLGRNIKPCVNRYEAILTIIIARVDYKWEAVVVGRQTASYGVLMILLG